MDIQLADITLHIKEALDHAERDEMEVQLRGLNGVVSVHNPDSKPHLVVVEYNPERLKSSLILKTVTNGGLHAELIGL